VPGLNLSRAEAKERADHLYVNSYVVTLDVTKGEETFYSKSEVSFTCNKPGFATFIDAVGRSVISATLNGVAVDTSNFDGESIFLTNLAADNLLKLSIQSLVKVCSALLIHPTARFTCTHKVRLPISETCSLALISQP
jgi:aminopeptidase N